MTSWLRIRVHVDRMVALALLVLLSPVIGVAAVRVRLDKGPAFVGVPRMGRDGVTFRMWKLRTMRADGADGLASGGSLALGEQDPRVTPLGRRLRRWRIDELPNLVNVVRGEMALIGPRPEAPDHVDLQDPRWSVVLSTPPGLVGPTQLLVETWETEVLAASGAEAYDTSVLPIKLAIDAWYVKGATPAVDLLVVRVLAGWLRTSRASQTRLHGLITEELGSVVQGLPQP